MQLLIFYLFAFGAVFSAVSMIMARQPVKSALFLILNMFCLAVHYAMLEAHLIAALQVLVYAGAIMVLVLFVIMLLNLREKRGVISNHKLLLQFVGIVGLSSVMMAVIARLDGNAIPIKNAPVEGFGTVVGVGRTLFTDYLLPFEIASVMLLAAIVGAVILTKRKV